MLDRSTKKRPAAPWGGAAAAAAQAGRAVERATREGACWVDGSSWQMLIWVGNGEEYAMKHQDS